MPSRWKAAYNDLIPLLAGLYPSQDRARLFVRNAGLEPDDIDLTGPPRIIWLRILEEADRRGMVQTLLLVGKSEYPNLDFDSLIRQLQEPALPSAPRLGNDTWKGPSAADGAIEKIIGNQPTFLPIRFLEIGMQRSRSVVRVHSPRGFGTGFITRNRLLVTNHHLIATATEARATNIWFNYQDTVGGAAAEIEVFELDPDSVFATSPMIAGDDWTIVKVKGDLDKWGFVDLISSNVLINSYVNIIQHPSNLPKQIALYHNIVVYADDYRVQYLTDTMPGSSGAPVFDSEWQLVALHHSGGWLPEPGTSRVYLRNEGIHVQAILRGLELNDIII